MQSFVESIFFKLEQNVIDKSSHEYASENGKISDIIQGCQLTVIELINAKKRKEIDADSFYIELERERAVLMAQLSACEWLNISMIKEHVNEALNRLKKLLKI